MTVSVLLWNMVRRTLKLTLKLNQSVSVHFVMLIEVNVHLITNRPGHACFQFKITSNGSFSLP